MTGEDVEVLAAALLTLGTLVGPLLFVLINDRPRRRQGDPHAHPSAPGTGAECAPAASPRSPQTPVGAGAPRLTAPTGHHRALVDATRRQPAASTSPQQRRVIGHD